jgi:hypothetical protein
MVFRGHGRPGWQRGVRHPAGRHCGRGRAAVRDARTLGFDTDAAVAALTAFSLLEVGARCWHCPLSRYPSCWPAPAGGRAHAGAGHVHHERRVPTGGCFQQRRPQPVGVAGIDFPGRRHHRHALDHLDRVPGSWHLCLPADAQDSAAIRRPGWAVAQTGQRGTPGPAASSTVTGMLLRVVSQRVRGGGHATSPGFLSIPDQAACPATAMPNGRIMAGHVMSDTASPAVTGRPGARRSMSSRPISCWARQQPRVPV